MGSSAADDAAADARRRRLLWHCRRGMKELDVLLSRYATERYPDAPAVQQRAFEAFLELQDPEINAYLLGYVISPDPQRAALIQAICAG